MTTVTWSAADVRAVIGVPLYNGVRRGHFQSALESLLTQSYPRVAFVFVDDGSTDTTPDVVANAAGRDARVTLVRNPTRLGLVANWVRSFRIGRERFPWADYFAWGSDHDVWDRGWLDRLVRELDEHPGAVLAFPAFTRIDAHDQPLRRPQFLRPTAGLTRPDRFAAACGKIGAGKWIYGLFRAQALERAGVYPLVLQPDVYTIRELSLYGEFRTVPEMLWYRRDTSLGYADERQSTGDPSRRQHSFTFIGKAPWYARMPVWLQHAWLLSWRLVVCGRGRPVIGRLEAAMYTSRLVARRVAPQDDRQKARRARKQQADGQRES